MKTTLKYRFMYSTKQIGVFANLQDAERKVIKLYGGGMRDGEYIIEHNGLEYLYSDSMLEPRECPRCNRLTRGYLMHPTYDYFGIYFRNVCEECNSEVEKIGYDGAPYGPYDECLDDEW